MVKINKNNIIKCLCFITCILIIIYLLYSLYKYFTPLLTESFGSKPTDCSNAQFSDLSQCSLINSGCCYDVSNLLQINAIFFERAVLSH